MKSFRGWVVHKVAMEIINGIKGKVEFRNDLTKPPENSTVPPVKLLLSP